MDSLTATPPLEGIIIPPEGGPSELVLVKRDPEGVFTDEAFINALMAQINTLATAFKPDTSTEKGRKQIASMAYRVSQTKTYLDGIGKDLVADLKERPKKIDAGRKTLRDRLDILRDEVRQPLDQWEARVQAIKDRIQGIKAMPATLSGADVALLEGAVAEVGAIDPSAEAWGEFAQEAGAAILDTQAVLETMLAKRRTYEADQAELARLRKEKEERERLDREEQIRKEAAEKERQAAEARAQAERDAAARREGEERLAREQAEQRQRDAEARLEQERKDSADREARVREQAAADERLRQEDEQARQREERQARERSAANRHKVLNEALADCMKAIRESTPPAHIDTLVLEGATKAILLGISKGQVRNVRIEF